MAMKKKLTCATYSPDETATSIVAISQNLFKIRQTVEDVILHYGQQIENVHVSSKLLRVLEHLDILESTTELNPLLLSRVDQSNRSSFSKIDTDTDDPHLRFLAFYDTLTHLPNRQYFSQKINKIIQKNKVNSVPFCLFFIDLDGFKEINDIHGHQIGDWLLEQVAKRLRQCLRLTDIVSRYGGDEFTILMEKNIADVKIVAERILKSLSQPFIWEGGVASVTASIGIAEFPNHGTDYEALLRYADQAMYDAKRQGKNCYACAS